MIFVKDSNYDPNKLLLYTWFAIEQLDWVRQQNISYFKNGSSLINTVSSRYNICIKINKLIFVLKSIKIEFNYGFYFTSTNL